MKKSFVLTILFILASCQPHSTVENARTKTIDPTESSKFYSKNAKEVHVQFKATYRTRLKSILEFTNLSNFQKKNFADSEIPHTVNYLFGPLTHRNLGGPQKNFLIATDLNSARLSKNGFIEFDYNYTGLWILNNELTSPFIVPLPMNAEVVFTKKWKNCTDDEIIHQTTSFFWYFWDPERYECDHQLNSEYQNISVEISSETKAQKISYPEYSKLLRLKDNKKTLAMTFAFGYVTDQKDPKPDTDFDFGIYEYQKFIDQMRHSQLNFKESDILQNEYLGALHPQKRLGSRFTATNDQTEIIVNVVSSAEIDQMELFAKSFSHDHDGFFGWFGHSRVGSGFDADQLNQMILRDPNYYNITKEYQLIYWAGCNSYSYYSLPFFKLKHDLDPVNDPSGTRALDILSHGLPSLFAFNAFNASVLYQALINQQPPTSYQSIVKSIEDNANASGVQVLVNILGDEDNPLF